MSYVWDKVESAAGAVGDAIEDTYNAMEDAVSDIYHEAERTMGKALEEFFRILGYTGENILVGDVFSQRLIKDSDLAKNITLSALIKRNQGQYTTPEYLMNILIGGRLKFTGIHNYADDTTQYARGLPILYFFDTIDMQETDAEQAIRLAEALEGEGVTVTEASYRFVSDGEYISAALYANWDYNPEHNTLLYNGNYYSYFSLNEIVTETYWYSTSPGTGLYTELFAYMLYNINVVQYHPVTYTITKKPFVETHTTSLPPEKDINGNPIEQHFVEEGYRYTARFEDYLGNLMAEKTAKIHVSRYELVNVDDPLPTADPESIIESGTFDYNTIPIEQLLLRHTINISESVIGSVIRNNITYDKVRVTHTGTFRYSSKRFAPNSTYEIPVYNEEINYYYIEYREQNSYTLTRNKTLIDYKDYTINSHSVPIVPKKDYELTISQGVQGYPSTSNLIYNVSCSIARYDNRDVKYIVVSFYKTEFPYALYWFVYDPSPYNKLIAYDAVPTLSGLLSSMYNYSSNSALPVIPLKENSKYLDEFPPEEENQIRGLLKKLEMDNDTILDSIKNDPNEANITEVYIHFALDPKASQNSELAGKYLWHLVNDSLDAKTVSITGTYNRSYTLSLVEEKYNTSISWEVLDKVTLSETATKDYEIILDEANKDMFIKRKINENTVERIVFHNVVANTLIKRGTESMYIGKTVGETGFSFPIIYEAINLLTPKEQIELLTETLHVSSYASEFIYLKYYETEDFADLLQGVAIAITIYTLGAGIEASGVLIALAKTAVQITISYGIKLALEYVYKQTDNDLFRILVTTTAIAATIYTGQELSDLDIVSMTTIKSATDIIQASMEIDLQYKAEQLEKEQIKFNENYEKKMDTLEEMYESLETNLDPFSIMQINTSTSNYGMSLLSIDSYYSMALGHVDMNYDNRYATGIDGYYDSLLKIGSI